MTKQSTEAVGLLTVFIGSQTVEITNVKQSDYCEITRKLSKRYWWWRTSLLTVTNEIGSVAIPVSAIVCVRWKQNGK